MDWSLDNLSPEEKERMKRGLGPHGQFFLIFVPRLIKEPPPKPEPYFPIDIPDNPHSPRFRAWIKRKEPCSPLS
jgi:hypothetical protein